MNHKPWLFLAIVLSAVSLLVVSCGGRAGEPNPTTTTDAPASLATPAPSPTASTGTAGSGSICPNGTLERCFSFGQMSGFLDQANSLVQPFFQAQYRGMSPSDVVFVPSNRMGRTICGGVDDQAYEYCGANDSIYVGQDLLWAFYNQFGDASPVVALAHEWGHHVQAYMRVPQPRTAAQSVRYENQADCIAGAWAQHAGKQGILETPDDLEDVGALLRAIGSGEGGDHGTASERRHSFDLGYNGGLSACNSFFPGNPVFRGGSDI